MMFGERLRKLRVEAYLSKTKMADELGITRQMIAKYESGDTAPTLVLFMQIAKHFGVSADYLLGTDGYEVQPDGTQKRSIALPDELTDEDYALIKDFVNTVCNRRAEAANR
jgi:transcriptional regulator with XRE-family HTH domain